MVTRRSTRSQATFDLLRQLALGLSAYQLFPDDPDQAGFVAAVERIREAATDALALNTRHVEVRSGRFHDADGSELRDEHLDRLAAACFERGVEFLSIRDVPSRADLRVVFRALSMGEHELTEAGGAGAVLERDGVVTIRLGDVTPEGDDGADRALEGLTAEQLDVWRTVIDPERFVANLLVEGLSAQPADAAEDVYRRFETVRAVLPVDLGASPELVQSLVRIVNALPADVQREFGARAITRARQGDELAGDYLGSMTDPELANVLIDLQAAEGPDARDVASELVERVGRHPGIVDVTKAFLEARGVIEAAEDGHDAGSAMAALSDTDGEAAHGLARDTAAELFASQLLAATDRDVAELRDRYPDASDTVRRDALNAFHDYLLSESDAGRLGQALEIWAGHLREAVGELDDTVLSDLLDVIDRASGELSDEEHRRLVRAARYQVLDQDLLRSLAERAKQDAPNGAVAVLRRFGATAEHALLDLLAVEDNRGTRAVLVSMISEILGDDVSAVVERLSDERWYLVRNCVTILGRVSARAGFHHLTPLVSHPHAQVRRELVRALVTSGGADAVAYLERLARDEDAGVRASAITALGSLVAAGAPPALGRVVDAGIPADETKRAIDELGRHPEPSATDVLADLASRRHRPRLSRANRRHAKSCLRKREDRP